MLLVDKDLEYMALTLGEVD